MYCPDCGREEMDCNRDWCPAERARRIAEGELDCPVCGEIECECPPAKCDECGRDNLDPRGDAVTCVEFLRQDALRTMGDER